MMVSGFSTRFEIEPSKFLEFFLFLEFFEFFATAEIAASLKNRYYLLSDSRLDYSIPYCKSTRIIVLAQSANIKVPVISLSIHKRNASTSRDVYVFIALRSYRLCSMLLLFYLLHFDYHLSIQCYFIS